MSFCNWWAKLGKKREAKKLTKKATRPSWRASFLAVVRYELLWNIRKKKFVGLLILVLAFTTLGLALPIILSNVNHKPIEPNPNYVINISSGTGGFSGFFLLLFALVSVMNSISGEFESGSIVPLLTKPVSRTTVYLGKFFAALLTVLGVYVVLVIYGAAGGYAIYGPQNNMPLIFVNLLGTLISTLVWMAIVLMVGSVSKSSMLAALLGIGIWFGLNITSGVLSAFSNQSWINSYIPGSGASGMLITSGPNNQTGIATGTDNIATILTAYALYPTANVISYRTEIVITPPMPHMRIVETASDPLSFVVARSLAVAAVYIFVFNFIAWYALKRAQVTE
jgi:ABC-type transport system involved in multi-copper enzyme maturation permease subunit